MNILHQWNLARRSLLVFQHTLVDFTAVACRELLYRLLFCCFLAHYIIMETIDRDWMLRIRNRIRTLDVMSKRGGNVLCWFSDLSLLHLLTSYVMLRYMMLGTKRYIAVKNDAVYPVDCLAEILEQCRHSVIWGIRIFLLQARRHEITAGVIETAYWSNLLLIRFCIVSGLRISRCVASMHFKSRLEEISLCNAHNHVEVPVIAYGTGWNDSTRNVEWIYETRTGRGNAACHCYTKVYDVSLN